MPYVVLYDKERSDSEKEMQELVRGVADQAREKKRDVCGNESKLENDKEQGEEYQVFRKRKKKEWNTRDEKA
ncbi:hypothetical protein RUM43_001907 [Polyplax serrata]|uniref:Uncharacterized protein n=1 Tax=Polyplax serrata TaxID=468196 RepID=A0AAN8XUR0_POLSC